MDKKSECDITKDLLSSYIENLLNFNSKKFAEEHLVKCDGCKKDLEMMKGKILEEKWDTLDDDKLEIKHLKKANRVIRFFKISFVLLLIIVLLIVAVFFGRYFYQHSIIDKAYQKVEELRNLDNYKLEERQVYTDYQANTITEYITTDYYKDGKSKEDNGNVINYYEDGSYNAIEIFHESKTINKVSYDYIPQWKGSIFNSFTEINTYGGGKGLKDLVVKSAVFVRTAKYKGKDCYVIRFQGNKEGYRDTWVDRESLLTTRVVEEKYGLYRRENIYTVTLNETLDSDVMLDFNKYSEYKVEETKIESPEELKQVYELMNKDN
jgi:hypothetical protein